MVVLFSVMSTCGYFIYYYVYMWLFYLLLCLHLVVLCTVMSTCGCFIYCYVYIWLFCLLLCLRLAVLFTVMSACGCFIYNYVVPSCCIMYCYIHPVVVSVNVRWVGLLYICDHGLSPVSSPVVLPSCYVFMYVHVHNTVKTC